MKNTIQDKSKLVNYVFTKVHEKYDVMNDIMSLGVHKVWKKNLINMMNPSINHNLIDVVGSEFDEYIPIYSPYIDNSELRYVNECIKKSWISSTGPLVSEFERRFSEFTGLEDCISTSNGSTALELAFTLCNLKPEDEIIAPALTFASPVNSAIRTGAKVKLIDVDKMDIFFGDVGGKVVELLQ